MPQAARTTRAGGSVRPIRNVLLVVALAGAAIAAAPAGAEKNPAAARLEAMARLLAKTPRLSVTFDCAYDVVQDSGEKIEFGERRVVALRRPDRARIDVTRRDGARRGLLFDGKQLAVFDLDANVYATVPKPGTVDAAFDHFVNDLNMRLPLRELLRTDLLRELEDVLGTARFVGEERLGGVATDHVAFRGDTTDVQIWIPRDGAPLPKRVVITYRLAAGVPQFAADLVEWNLAPELPETLFQFTPAAGAEQIPVLVPEGGKKP
jgi:hypothetical protein